MSDEAPDQESKTEDPSGKKLEDAFKRGDVAKSQEVVTWFMLLGSAVVFAMMAPSTSAALMTSLETVIMNADRFDVTGAGFGAFFNNLALALVGTILVPLLVLSTCAVLANLVQHRPLFSAEPITPKFTKISPLAGAKRLFSGESLVNFGKGLVKIAIVGAVLVVVTLIAGADYFYVRQKWWKRQMMTLQETRDEFKQMEGDPHIKGKLRQLRQERSRKRMMAAVPDATVVITNPTHFAVALKYEKGMAAPKCVAKGADAVAFRIRELAKEHDVPIVENPPLARALFAAVDVDETIPGEHFKAVAEVIGFVMRLKNGQGWKAR